MASKFLDYSGLSYLWGKLKVLLAGKQDTLVSGTNIKTVNGVTVLGTGNVQNLWYGTSTTAKGTQTKVVTTTTGNFTLTAGNMLRVKFSTDQTYNGQAKLQVDGTTATGVTRVGTTAAQRYIWLAGEVLDFVYDGTNFVAVNEGIATTTYYGTTKLSSSLTSTSEATALTPKALNQYAQNTATNLAVYSSSSTYAVGDRVRYDSHMYKCKTAITTAEAWTAAHWTVEPTLLEKIDAITVPTKVSDLQNDSGFLTLSTLPIYDGSVQ